MSGVQKAKCELVLVGAIANRLASSFTHPPSLCIYVSSWLQICLHSVTHLVLLQFLLLLLLCHYAPLRRLLCNRAKVKTLVSQQSAAVLCFLSLRVHEIPASPG